MADEEQRGMLLWQGDALAAKQRCALKPDATPDATRNLIRDESHRALRVPNAETMERHQRQLQGRIDQKGVRKALFM